MPILPENRNRYPHDWPMISLAVKERAGWRCEGSPDHPYCRVKHGALGGRGPNGNWLDAMPLGDNGLRLLWPEQGSMHWCVGGGVVSFLRIIKIVLTVGHLDHKPENCDLSNLRAWCQRCHLHYDRHHHYATRRAGRAIQDLFPERPTP